MFSGNSRPIQFPINESDGYVAEVPDIAVPYLTLADWPASNPDEVVSVEMLLSLNEYVALASAVDVGRDIAFGEESNKLWWLWSRAYNGPAVPPVGGGAVQGLIYDLQPQNSAGGSMSSGAYNVRNLNTVHDPFGIGITLLGSNQFSLPSGDYVVDVSCPGYRLDLNFCQLLNVTDTLIPSVNQNANFIQSSPDQGIAQCQAVFSIAGTKTFQVMHYCTRSQATNGGGLAINVSSRFEIYTIVKITKQAGS